MARKSRTVKTSAVPQAPISSPPPAFSWAVPDSLEIPPDPLRCRLDFHNQAVVLHLFEDNLCSTRIVSAMDVAHALASELSFSTGLLPENALWWSNTPDGAAIALYEPPQVRRVALQDSAAKPPQRFNIPLPGLIFLCEKGQPPSVYAVKQRPCNPGEPVYHAPLCNIFADGRSCPGNHKYPADAGAIPDSFFQSFFTSSAHLTGRSKKHPDNIVKMWKEVKGKKAYPLDDLVKFGTVKDLMERGQMKHSDDDYGDDNDD